MISTECIKRDLRDIRYYYMRKAQLESADSSLGTLPIKRTAEKYNCAIRNAPLRLCDLYICLYLKGQTQEAVAIEWGYTPQYIRKMLCKLITFFKNNLSARRI